MNHARCHGGPLNGRGLAHPGYGYRLAYERHNPMKSIPGIVTSHDPGIAFGIYVYDAVEEIWRWSSEAPPVLAKTSVDSDRDKRLVP